MPRGRKPVGDHALSNAERQSLALPPPPLEATLTCHDPNTPTDRST